MQIVRLSSRFQVVIPKRIREELNLSPGQELQIYVRDGSVRFRPPRPLERLKGIAKDTKWKDIYRDHRDWP